MKVFDLSELLEDHGSENQIVFQFNGHIYPINTLEEIEVCDCDIVIAKINGEEMLREQKCVEIKNIGAKNIRNKRKVVVLKQ